MCDYSLYTFKSRLAVEADELVLHRFHTGSLGFTSVCELQHVDEGTRLSRPWSSFISWILPRRLCGLTAVCTPPGARLRLNRVPADLQSWLEIGEIEEVVFTQLCASSFCYRDALVFRNKTTVLLQDLPEGLSATILSLGCDDVAEVEPVKVSAARR